MLMTYIAIVEAGPHELAAAAYPRRANGGATDLSATLRRSGGFMPVSTLCSTVDSDTHGGVPRSRALDTYCVETGGGFQRPVPLAQFNACGDGRARPSPLTSTSAAQRDVARQWL
jgi:hypothetical protein